MFDALLARIGLDRWPAADVDGLRTLHRAFVSRVPYEDIAVQFGETGDLDEHALAERVLQDGRGGYCFELNTLFAALLRAAGFVVHHHQSVVGGEGPTNHMALVVAVDGETWLADAGLGEGFMEPLPLREGGYERGPLSYTLTREPSGTWWMGQHEWGSITGFRMQASPSSLADFEPHHRRLATSPESPFVRTLVVQRPFDDRIVTLRARTLSSVGPSVDTKRVLSRVDFGIVLREVFGIRLSSARLERLWQRAAAQHEAFMAALANTGH